MNVRPSSLELVADIASICADPAPVTARAAAVLDRLAEHIPLEAAALSTLDPSDGDGRHVTVAERGYPTAVLDYLNTGFATTDPAFLTMRFRNPTPLRWCDIPNYQGMFSAHEVFIPGGFREGATSCLFTRDGRYTGALHVSSDSPLPISDSAVALLIVLKRVIAPLMDAMRPAEEKSWAEEVHDADEAVLLTSDGRAISLGGVPRGRWLSDGSPLVIELSGRRQLPRRFTWVSKEGSCHEIRTNALAAGRLVSIRESPAPYRLSPREIEVLTDARVTVQTERRARGPWGLEGGRSGQPGRNTLIRPDGTTQVLPAKVTLTVQAGDRIRLETPGGGGWGTQAAHQ